VIILEFLASFTFGESSLSNGWGDINGFCMVLFDIFI
jgi:hypothetical protein